MADIYIFFTRVYDRDIAVTIDYHTHVTMYNGRIIDPAEELRNWERLSFHNFPQCISSLLFARNSVTMCAETAKGLNPL